MRLEIDPLDGPADAAPAIRVSGAPAGAAVTLAAAATDAAGRRWASRSRFRADAGGVVDLHRDAPQGGTYRGVDPGGPLWSMATAAGSGAAPGGGEPEFAVPAFRLSVRVTATAAGVAGARAVMVRRWRAPGVSLTRAAGPGFSGRLYLPAGGGRSPAVALVPAPGEGPPRPPSLWPVAALLASHGYAALVLGATSLGQGGDHYRQPPALATGLRWLAAHRGVDPRRLTAAGVGGGAGDLLAALAGAPDVALRAAAVFASAGAILAAVTVGHPARVAAPILFVALGGDSGGGAAERPDAVAEAVWRGRRGSGYEPGDRYLSVPGAPAGGLAPPLVPVATAEAAEGRARAAGAAWTALLEFLEEHLGCG